MRASRALPTLPTALTYAMLCACGRSDDGGSASTSGATSDATTSAADTGAASITDTPTTGREPATDGASSSDDPTTTPTSTTTGPLATTTGATESTSASTTALDATDTASDTSTSTGLDTTNTTTDGTDTTSTTDSTASTGPECPTGEHGCPCGPGDACDPGLVCAQGVCAEPVPKCGDGKQDPGEACDDGPGNGDTKACKLDCSKQACGDGDVGPGEQCDDGNAIDGDGCQATCVLTPAKPKDACGFDSDGVWFQIDYTNAFTVSSPTYSYSPTPGWGEAQWAPNGKSWPYAVDLFNNASVVEDQIGRVALLNGTNKAVRVYFGLTGLEYTYATVCVEGRSYSVSSSVTFLVQEAKTKCGDTGMMANDWTVHATGVDLQTCFLPGDNFQAVQVQPSSGSGALSLKRLRVTLHGATY